MSYIGKEPIVGNFQKCDAITESSTATYNLTVGSVAVFPETANNCIVSLNGVIQAPTDAYTISGSTIVFNSSLTSADVVDFILILGSVLNIGTVSDDTITLAKMAGGTDGNIISYDASGNPVAVATGSDGQVLTSSGAGAVCAFEAAPAGGITETDQWRITANHSGTGTITANWERNDTTGFGLLGTGMSESSGIFTFPSTGYWFIIFKSQFNSDAASLYVRGDIEYTANNSSYSAVASDYGQCYTGTAYGGTYNSFLADITDLTNHKVRFALGSNQGGTPQFFGNTSTNKTYATFTKLAGT